MTYDELLAGLAEISGLNSEVVRRTLFHLPDVLLKLEVGETVRTPMGVYRMTQTRPRIVVLPDGRTEAQVVAKSIVKLKPGNRLRIEDEVTQPLQDPE